MLETNDTHRQPTNLFQEEQMENKHNKQINRDLANENLKLIRKLQKMNHINKIETPIQELFYW